MTKSWKEELPRDGPVLVTNRPEEADFAMLKPKDLESNFSKMNGFFFSFKI